eukprot:9499465-Prorocentrum_lima.AAC.1
MKAPAKAVLSPARTRLAWARLTAYQCSSRAAQEEGRSEGSCSAVSTSPFAAEGGEDRYGQRIFDYKR